MTTEHKTDKQSEPRQQAQDEPHEKHPGQQAHQDKSSTGFDTMTDTRKQEQAGKGKIATSSPGGSEPDSQRD